MEIDVSYVKTHFQIVFIFFLFLQRNEKRRIKRLKNKQNKVIPQNRNIVVIFVKSAMRMFKSFEHFFFLHIYWYLHFKM